ncbi:MAG: sel1 repeat family protein [Proteobacteria bacterium]|nr:sel1 repeat family protein [Pseudomonadota bacterium]NOG60912.1 sel1 repeat family protein [Pseudomonadota bacterium]
MKLNLIIISLLVCITSCAVADVEDYPCNKGKQLLEEGRADEAILFWRKRADSTSVYYQSRQVFGCLADTNILTHSNQIYSILESFAKEGSSQAELMLGIRHLQSSAIDPNAIKDATYWIERAMEQGNVDAKMIYAIMYTSNTKIRKDIDYAMKLFNEAANDGSILAQASLAKTYKKGRYGIEVDLSKAHYWSQKVDETTTKLNWTSKKEYKEYRKSLESN